MGKELIEMLKDINKTLDKIIEVDDDKIKKAIDEAFKGEATISMKKYKDGRAETHMEGDKITLLIALAGLEKNMLEKLEVPSLVWEHFRSIVGTTEVK